MGRALSRLRGVRVVQTIASPPRSFDGIERLLFGDVVVAQSEWTRAAALAAFAATGRPAPRMEVIPPPVAPQAMRSTEAQAELRKALSIPGDAKIFCYPGDLEVSAGAQTVLSAVRQLAEAVPGAVVVFAYRAKTPRAHRIAESLSKELAGAPVRFSCELPDVLSLVCASEAVLFPVDDLWGKVDLPIVLLEAMDLGVPVVALDAGPLKDLRSVEKVSTQEPSALVAAVQRLLAPAHRASVVAAQREEIASRHRAQVVASAYEQLYLSLC
jgi:phosphatidylinositol alpha-1,6-mannosyltransferase